MFSLLQAKRGKGGVSNTAVQGPEYLALEVAATQVEELVEEEEPPQGLYLQPLFPTVVPHLKYQWLLTMAGENQTPELARKLWQGGRFVLKQSTMERRVRFATKQDTSHHPGARDDPPAIFCEGQLRLMPPAGLCEHVLRECATLFGVSSRSN